MVAQNRSLKLAATFDQAEVEYRVSTPRPSHDARFILLDLSPTAVSSLVVPYAAPARAPTPYSSMKSINWLRGGILILDDF
jgi:hypothetical protein